MPRCQIWTPPGLSRVLLAQKSKVLDLHPGEYFLSKQYIPENNSRQNRASYVCCMIFKDAKSTSLKGQSGLFELATFLERSHC